MIVFMVDCITFEHLSVKFVSKRRNKSGTISAYVVDKSSGRFKEPTLLGVASTSEEIAVFEIKAQHWVGHYGGQQTLDL